MKYYNAQVVEIMANVKAINKVIGLAISVRSWRLVTYGVVYLLANLINKAYTKHSEKMRIVKLI
ncbi:hypothetical protein VYA_12920 [Vibrio alfacsensis]|nr:hypothetical protein VYA_12920 [Vibrio alfacsensis]